MIELKKDFFNSWGGVKTSATDPGNNAVLFFVYLRKLCLDYHEIVGPRIYDEKLSVGNYVSVFRSQVVKRKKMFDATPGDGVPGNYSIDNMTALYWIAKHVESLDPNVGKDLLKSLPVWRWNGRTWWHPNGWAVFAGLKWAPFKWLFYPLILGMALVGASRERTRTTGFLLWFIRLDMLGMERTWRLFEKIMAWANIYQAFIYYHSMGYANPENLAYHPNCAVAKEIDDALNPL